MSGRQFDAGVFGSRGLDLVRGQGAHVYDGQGRRYLDATSMYGVASLGHAHPALVRALSEQAARLVSCFGSYGNDQRDRLLERLHGLLQPLDRFFLCNSGTEAVEAALKLARWFTGRPGVVALCGGFHGRTFGALSATWRPSHREAFEPLLPGFRHVRPGDLESLRAELDAGDVGLFLVEIVQGEGGVLEVDEDFLRAARELCRERGVLFGVDEVQTGIGRTGRWFGFQHAGLDPDLVCLAKGLASGVPIGCTAFRGSLGRLPIGVHGSTFGGNPLSCAAAVATLDAIEEEGLVEAAAARGARLVAHLRELCGEDVREVRGRGLMIGIELRGASQPVQKRLQEEGVLALGAGRRVLRLLPPLVTAPRDLELLAEAVAQAVARTIPEVAR